MVTAPENQQQSMPQYKIVLYGESGAGKTSLLMKYMNPSHSEEQSPLSTIGIDFRAKTQVVEDKTVSLQIWDTAGQERFMSSINAFDKLIRKANASILVFDVERYSSIAFQKNNYKKILDEYKNGDPDRLELYLAVTKCDKVDEAAQKEYAAKIIEEFGMEVPTFFCSIVGDGLQIPMMFLKISKDLLQKDLKKKEQIDLNNNKTDIDIGLMNAAASQRTCC